MRHVLTSRRPGDPPGGRRGTKGETPDMTTAIPRPGDAPASGQTTEPYLPAARTSGPGTICACLQARMTARALTRLYDEALRPTGLKVTQLSLLAAIDRGVTGSISALADMLALERTTLTRNLKLLGDAGLIAPRTGGGRAVTHALTDLGRDALARATPLWRMTQDAIENGMGPQAWQEARASLRALRRVAGAQKTPGDIA